MKKLIRAEIRKRNVFSTHRLKQLLLVVLFFICLDVNAQVRRAIFMNRTGTITATTGSAIVNGVGTSFLTDLIPGNSIYKNATSTSNGVPTLGVILSIQSNTQLTLAANSAVAASGDIYCSSEFTPADFALLACTIKTYLDGHHYDYVMKHISPCNDPTDQPDDPDCVSLSGVTRERIHQTAATSPVAERGINFLPWHRHFINKLEELFMLSGMPQFVPMPYWNPATPIPDVFFDPTVAGQCSEAEIIGTDWLDLPDIANQDISNVSPFNGTSETFWANRWSGLTTCNSASRQALANSMGPGGGPHGDVHLSVVNVGFHQATGYTWFYIWHAFVDDVWRKWECTCTNNPAEQISAGDLFMMDRNSDEGLPMMESLDVGYEPFVSTKAQWESQDIWVRNQNDGFTTDVNEDPIAQVGIPVYVYVRVRNRSCTDYAGGGTLDLRWAKGSTALSWPAYWDGSLNCIGSSNAVMGDLLATQTIPAIGKGSHVILEFPWYPPNPSDYNSCTLNIWNAPLHFCLLARILDTNDPMAFTETANLGANVLNNNNIVWKNLTLVDAIPGIAHQEDCSKEMLVGGVIDLGSPYNATDKYDINFKLPDDIGDKTPITEVAEVKMILDETTWSKWQAGGFQNQNIIVKHAPCHEIMVTGNPASIKNLTYDAYQQSTMYVTFNFLTDHITPTQKFDYQVVQTRNEDGALIGGESYHIVKHDRLPFVANAGADQNIARHETTTLTATDIGEDAVYNWYIVGGDKIGSERVIQVNPEVDTQYELEVISRSDGFKCYDRVNVHIKPFAITSLDPNPATDQLTVKYYAEQATSAQIIITQPYGYEHNYEINPQATDININVSEFSPGVYFVLLICNGNPADMKSIVIE